MTPHPPLPSPVSFFLVFTDNAFFQGRMSLFAVSLNSRFNLRTTSRSPPSRRALPCRFFICRVVSSASFCAAAAACRALVLSASFAFRRSSTLLAAYPGPSSLSSSPRARTSLLTPTAIISHLPPSHIIAQVHTLHRQHWAMLDLFFGPAPNPNPTLPPDYHAPPKSPDRRSQLICSRMWPTRRQLVRNTLSSTTLGAVADALTQRTEQLLHPPEANAPSFDVPSSDTNNHLYLERHA